MTRRAGLAHRCQGRLAVGIHLPRVVRVGLCPRTVGSIRSGYQSFVRGRKSLGRLRSSAWSPYQPSMPRIGSSGCTQSVADASFGAGEDRHGRCGDTGGPDSEPARVWVVAARQRADGLDADVRREEEAGGDPLLCSPFGDVRAASVAGEEPEHELADMPADSGPGEESRASLERGPLGECASESRGARYGGGRSRAATCDAMGDKPLGGF
jgi:hypothetical protein